MRPASALRKAAVGAALLALFLLDMEINPLEIQLVAEAVKLV